MQKLTALLRFPLIRHFIFHFHKTYVFSLTSIKILQILKVLREYALDIFIYNNKVRTFFDVIESLSCTIETNI